MLVGIHFAVASMAGAPEFIIDETQAAQLARGLADVQSHYDMIVSPEAMAWINLGMIATSIYGPKAYMMIRRKRAETEAKKKQAKEAAENPFGYTGNIIDGQFTRGPTAG